MSEEAAGLAEAVAADLRAGRVPEAQAKLVQLERVLGMRSAEADADPVGQAAAGTRAGEVDREQWLRADSRLQRIQLLGTLLVLGMMIWLVVRAVFFR